MFDDVWLRDTSVSRQILEYWDEGLSFDDIRARLTRLADEVEDATKSSGIQPSGSASRPSMLILPPKEVA